MLTLRPAQWPQDEDALSSLDTSFATGRIYRPVRDGLSFQLMEEIVNPPLRKEYEFPVSNPCERRSWDYAVLAEEDGRVVGAAAAQYFAWNRRVALWHLYVGPPFRGLGVGTRLLAAVDAFAQSVQARCLWVETQNTNYPAVRFYQQSGFRFCGFDESLYDLASEEIALFFARPVGAAPNRHPQ